MSSSRTFQIRHIIMEMKALLYDIFMIDGENTAGHRILPGSRSTLALHELNFRARPPGDQAQNQTIFSRVDSAVACGFVAKRGCRASRVG